MASAYDLLAKTREERLAAIEQQTKAQEGEKKLREHNAQQELEANNRGVYTTYKNAINPYGTTAAQNNIPTGVSEYMKNAAYGTMLQGLGRNRTAYNTSINNSNTLWQNYLAQKSGQESDIEAEYAANVIAQQNYDKEQAENRRRYELSQASSGYGYGGGDNIKLTGGIDDISDEPIRLTTTNPTGAVINKNASVYTPIYYETVYENGKWYELGINDYGAIVSRKVLKSKDLPYHTFDADSNK